MGATLGEDVGRISTWTAARARLGRLMVHVIFTLRAEHNSIVPLITTVIFTLLIDWSDGTCECQ